MINLLQILFSSAACGVTAYALSQWGDGSSSIGFSLFVVPVFVIASSALCCVAREYKKDAKKEAK
jgi:hypothetical protein